MSNDKTRTTEQMQEAFKQSLNRSAKEFYQGKSDIPYDDVLKIIQEKLYESMPGSVTLGTLRETASDIATELYELFQGVQQ